MTRAELKALVAAAVDAQQGVPDPHAIADQIIAGLSADEMRDVVGFLLPPEVRAIANDIRKQDVRRASATVVLRRGHSRAGAGRIPVPREIQQRSIDQAMTAWAPVLQKTRLGEVDHEGALVIAQSYEVQGEALLELAERWRQVADRLPPGTRLAQLPLSELAEIVALLHPEEEADAEAV